MSLWWVFAFYLAERGLEMVVAGRNRRRMLTAGAVECYPESYRQIVVLHSLFFIALLAESYPWRFPLDTRTVACLAGLVLLQGGRYACIAALGRFWNTRIIVLPGAELVRRGPYRWLRHPNYLVVTLEFVLIPLLMRAPYTLLIFSLANAVVLRHRITLEERALAACASEPERTPAP